MLSAFLLISNKYGLNNLRIRWGQSAWLQINCIFSNYQRLNIEQSKNKNNLMYDQYNYINKSKLNKIRNLIRKIRLIKVNKNFHIKHYNI